MNNKLYYKIRITVAGIVGILAILGIIGIFYPVKIFDVQFAVLLQRVFVDFSLVALVLLIASIGLTLLFGRIYCSTICPFGIFQELASLIFRRKNSLQKNLPVKYFIAAATFGTLAGGTALLLRYVEPYTIFGSAMTLSALGLVAFILVLVAVFFKNRIFCTNICPVGTVLGLISKLSLNKIYIDKDDCLSCGKCVRSCPSGCINVKEKTVDNETCVKCLKCIGECAKDAIKYGKEPTEPVKFNTKRRELIGAVSALALFGVAVKAGIVLKDKIGKKIADTILPPGAISEERFINKCFNCNLCVKHCPNKIIKKADENYDAVHLDYENGYCKFDCNECSKVCPSGAIKRITLDEKQRTRIAMASINSDTCIKCGICVLACPVKALSKKKDKPPILDASKCIGCGSCKKACRSNAIEIFAIKEQRVL